MRHRVEPWNSLDEEHDVGQRLFRKELVAAKFHYFLHAIVNALDRKGPGADRLLYTMVIPYLLNFTVAQASFEDK